MPLKTFETKDAVPEAQREGAIETKDGKFLVLEEPDNTALVSALDKERKDRKDLAAKVAKMELDAKAKDGGLTTEKLDEIKAQVRAEYEPKLKELEKAQGDIRTLKLHDRVKGMLVSAEFIDAEAAYKIVGEDFDLTDDGQPIVKGQPAKDLKKHIDEIAAKYPFLVKGSQASGGGSGGSRKGGPAGDVKVSTLKGPELEAFLNKHGSEEFQRRLDAEAVDILNGSKEEKK
jgi:hypothetical protein